MWVAIDVFLFPYVFIWHIILHHWGEDYLDLNVSELFNIWRLIWDWFVQRNLSVTSGAVHTVYSPQQFLIFFPLSHSFFLTHIHTHRQACGKPCLLQCFAFLWSDWLFLPWTRSAAALKNIPWCFFLLVFFISSVCLCQNAQRPHKPSGSDCVFIQDVLALLWPWKQLPHLLAIHRWC